MKEEIIGPVFPVLRFDSTEEAITLMGSEELKNPLALYIFSKDRRMNDKIIAEVPAGATVVNDVMFHYTNLHLPFGGRGNSGIGAYHGTC